MSLRKQQPKYNINVTFDLSLNISYIKAYIKEILKMCSSTYKQTFLSKTHVCDLPFQSKTSE